LRIRLLSLLAMISLGVIPVLPAARAQRSTASPEIWVAVISPPINASERWKGIRTDAPDQWKPDAPWARAADLHAVLDDIKRRHMDLALEIGPLIRSADCAPATEAYGKPGETEAILQKIRAEGGVLRYAMDEPFFYGQRDAGGCHYSRPGTSIRPTLFLKPTRALSAV
jgi:hypothetical protein